MIDSLRRIASSPKLPDPRKRRMVMALHVFARIALFPVGLLRWRRRLPRELGPTPRILLMRVDGIGDLVMTTGLFPALRSAYPGARIDLVCSTAAEGLAELFVRSRDLDELFPLPLRGGWPGRAM